MRWRWHSRDDWKLFAIGGLLLAIMFPATVLAGEISVEWDPVVGEIDGYRVYYGNAPGNYQATLDISPTITSAIVTNLADCQNHYIAVKAFKGGETSESFGVEVFGWPRPHIDTVTPSEIIVGQAEGAIIVVQGGNFMDDADLQVAGPARFTGEVQTSCETMSATLGNVPSGLATLQVEVHNPHTDSEPAGFHTWGFLSDGIQIVPAVPIPDVNGLRRQFLADSIELLTLYEKERPTWADQRRISKLEPRVQTQGTMILVLEHATPIEIP
jgi:hypothetical protein